MAQGLQPTEVRPLTDEPVPNLFEAQLRVFSDASIHSSPVRPFNAANVANAMADLEGQQVLGADFGGDKGMCRLLTVHDGVLVDGGQYREDIQGDDGKGYLSTIQQATAFATTHALPLGLSWGGPLDHTNLLYHPKAAQFYADVQMATGGDLAKLSPSIAATLNDGPAGLISGAVEAYRQYKAQTVMFVINGGGIGLGVLKDNTILATEAGHVQGSAELNTYHQTEPCGVFGATYVCLERLGANKAGIEAQWQAETGSYMRAIDIEGQYKLGNALAAALYDHSALALAHVIQGAARALGIDVADKGTVIVGHGGAFKFPAYGERIAQILSRYNSNPVQLIMTKDYTNPSTNACLDGAAIAALTASSN